jgi:hypothetical protein
MSKKPRAPIGSKRDAKFEEDSQHVSDRVSNSDIRQFNKMVKDNYSRAIKMVKNSRNTNPERRNFSYDLGEDTDTEIQQTSDFMNNNPNNFLTNQNAGQNPGAGSFSPFKKIRCHEARQSELHQKVHRQNDKKGRLLEHQIHWLENRVQLQAKKGDP